MKVDEGKEVEEEVRKVEEVEVAQKERKEVQGEEAKGEEEEAEGGCSWSEVLGGGRLREVEVCLSRALTRVEEERPREPLARLATILEELARERGGRAEAAAQTPL